MGKAERKPGKRADRGIGGLLHALNMRDGQGWIVLSVSTANLCNCMANREDGPVFSQVEKKEDLDGVKGGTTATMSRHQSCPKAALSRMA